MFLLDTNVVSEPTKKTPDAKVAKWFASTQGIFYVSVLTLGELRKGVELTKDERKKAYYQNWLENGIGELFKHHTLDITAEIADIWGKISAGLHDKTKYVDALIAATAKAHKLTLVTRNSKDFEGFGIKLLNPWE